MTIQTILITILGGGALNMIVSAVANHFQGDDVAKCARSGLAGGIAGGIFACVAYFAGINLNS